MVQNIGYIIGISYTVIIGHIYVKNIANTIKQLSGVPKEAQTNPSLPAIVGNIERILYLAALLIGKFEFIGVWLVMKIAGEWNSSEKDFVGVDKETKESTKGIRNYRVNFNIFLIGSSLSLAFAYIGYKIIKWDLSNSAIDSINMFIYPIGFVVILSIWLLYLWHWAYIYNKINSLFPNTMRWLEQSEEQWIK